jgi:hypothetical protein
MTCAFVIWNVCAIIGLRLARKSTSDKALWVLNQRNQSYDFIVAGSSRAATMIDVPILEDILAKKGLNIGYEGGAAVDQYLFSHLFLKSNKTKLFILQIDEFLFDNRFLSYPFHDFIFALFSDDANVLEALQETRPAEWRLWRYCPGYLFSSFNMQYISFAAYALKKQIFSPNVPEIYNLLKGYKYDVNFDEGFYMPKKNTLEVQDINRKYFLKMVRMLQDMGIPLVLVRAPIYDEAFTIMDSSPYEAFIHSFAQNAGVHYLDYAKDSTLSKDKSYFNNYAHMNKKGIREFTNRLGNDLKTF